MKVAVYGSLKKGFGNHRLLETSERLGTDKITGWTMHSMSAYPCICEGGDDISIEVYEINESTFSALDMLEGYPSFYNRKEVSTKYGTAWIYYIEDDMSGYEVVPSGIWEEQEYIGSGWV